MALVWLATAVRKASADLACLDLLLAVKRPQGSLRSLLLVHAGFAANGRVLTVLPPKSFEVPCEPRQPDLTLRCSLSRVPTALQPLILCTRIRTRHNHSSHNRNKWHKTQYANNFSQNQNGICIFIFTCISNRLSSSRDSKCSRLIDPFTSQATANQSHELHTTTHQKIRNPNPIQPRSPLCLLLVRCP